MKLSVSADTPKAATKEAFEALDFTPVTDVSYTEPSIKLSGGPFNGMVIKSFPWEDFVIEVNGERHLYHLSPSDESPEEYQYIAELKT